MIVKHGLGWKVQYYSIFQVALDKRPYIAETIGKLLVKYNTFDAKAILKISLKLPCLNFDASNTNEVALEFSLDKILKKRVEFIHSDAEILITISSDNASTVVSTDHAGSTTILSYKKRFHKEPPPPNTSNNPGMVIEPVQVNHATRSLYVNGLPYIGNGYYVSGVASLTIAEAKYFFQTMSTYSINQFMFYGIWERTPDYIMKLFDLAASYDSKIMYSLNFEEIKRSGPFNDTNLQWYKNMVSNITLVKNHRALLVINT